MAARTKKSETIEIRLSHDAKSAFMARCRQDRRTASDAIRLFIDDLIDERPTRTIRKPSWWRTILAGGLGLVLGLGVAAPSLAREAQDPHAAFNALDRNHDGVLSYPEYRGR